MPHPTPPPAQAGLWTRDGHLAELGVNRLLTADLPQHLSQALQHHLAACPRCAARLEAARAADAEFRASALGAPPWLAALQAPEAPVVDLAARRAQRRTWAVATLAAAASLALVTAVALRGGPSLPQPPEDLVRSKGRAFAMEVYANSPEGTRGVPSGGEVHPGERVGFRIYPKTKGYVMVLGVDDRGEDYLCYPRRGDKGAALQEAAPEGVTLEQAMRLDEVLGHERLVALLCPEPFTYDEVAPQLKAQAQRVGAGQVGPLRAGCQQHEVRLLKTAPPEEP